MQRSRPFALTTAAWPAFIGLGSNHTQPNEKGQVSCETQPLEIMVPSSGFEPEAYGLGGRRSIHLSYEGVLFQTACKLNTRPPSCQA